MTQTNPTSNPASWENIYQWEIWLVDWDHEDGTSKVRRALVISSSAYNAGNEEIWFAKISKQKHEVEHRLELNKSDAAFAGTGLTDTSYFYLAKAKFAEQWSPQQISGRLMLDHPQDREMRVGHAKASR